VSLVRCVAKSDEGVVVGPALALGLVFLDQLSLGRSGSRWLTYRGPYTKVITPTQSFAIHLNIHTLHKHLTYATERATVVYGKLWYAHHHKFHNRDMVCLAYAHK